MEKYIGYHLIPNLIFHGSKSDGVADALMREYAPILYKSLGRDFKGVSSPFSGRHDTADDGEVPFLALDKIVTSLPEARQSDIRDLETRFLATIADILPAAPGAIETEIGVLAKDYRAYSPSTVVLRNTLPDAIVYMIFPYIFLDPETGVPSVQKLGSSLPQEVVKRNLGSVTLASAESSMAKDVATNLAFTLPPPYGPVAAASLSLIFGSLFGQSGPNLADVIQAKIEQAVKEIKAFLTDQQFAKAESDFQVYMNSLSVSASKTDIISDAVSKGDYTDAINQAKKNVTADPDSLLNELQLICNSQLKDLADPVTPENDRATSAIVLGVTSILVSYHVIARLSLSLFQFYLEESQQDATPTTDSLQYDIMSQKALYDYCSAVNDLNLQIGTGDLSSKSDEPDYSRALSAVQNSDPAVFAHYIKANVPQIGADAHDLGWASAVLRIVRWRKVARILAIGFVVPYDDRSSSCHSQGGSAGGGGCHTDGDDGYQFTDICDGTKVSIATHHWSSGCCNQNDHAEDHQADVAANRTQHIAAVDQELAGVYNNVTDTVKKWIDNAAKLINDAPPSQPNAPTITKMTGLAVPNSRWAKATEVKYAFAVAKTATSSLPSPRSDFSAAFKISGNSAPEIASLPAKSQGIGRLDIWRQFIYPDTQNPDAALLGAPIFIQSLTDWQDSWIDKDRAFGVSGPA